MKKIIMIILVIMWASLIYYASSRTSIDSNNKSKELIYNVSKRVIIITNKLKLTNIDIDDDNYLKNIADKYNYPVRKCAHVFVYFVLSILLFILFKCFNISGIKIYLIILGICFIYSLTDEYHQIYINGRSATIMDCLIDMIGVFISCFIFLITNRFKSKVRT